MDRVHTLRFVDRAELTRAYHELAASESIEDCLVETEALELRFLAPGDIAARVIERIYLSGGLVWSSEHPLSAEAPLGRD